MDHVPLKHKLTTLGRADRFISTEYFSDVNLRSKLFTEKLEVASIKHYAAPDRVPFAEALKGDYKPVSVGQSFGPIWSTHWFEIDINIPAAWVGGEVHFLWNSNSEALVWVAGEPVQGLNQKNSKNYYILSRKVDSGSLKHTLFVEMACNHLFGVGNLALVDPKASERTFTLSQVEIALFNRDVFDLILDIECLHDMANNLKEDQRGYQALYTVNEMINSLDLEDVTTWPKCREMANAFFSQKNGDSQHTVYAVGHAHIDSAWLWPCAETIRKCARSWSCSLRLMERWPDFVFACSQAQQYSWVKEHYPGMWKDICKFVHKGQFVPVGGTWVEMDGNIPSGEACFRQFLYGQAFFKEEFGVLCKEFWLPDTFGYSGQFPQILQHFGISRFLTQKLSWSLINKFPHHTFLWEGIDGSTVLAHFPPGDSYEMEGKAHELLNTVNNFRDKGRSNCSAFLFGHGDGGHGPSEQMLERLKRFKDCNGMPRVKLSGIDQFFSKVERETPKLLCRWKGELYLEMHNGTYTTWAKVKKGNRECEVLLVELEAVCSLACLHSQDWKYPHSEIQRLWKQLLLNQFHDILPGSSITLVFKDAMKLYEDIRKSSARLFDEAITAILKKVMLMPLWSWSTPSVNEEKGKADMNSTQHGSLGQQQYIVNSQAFARTEVVRVIPSKEYTALPAEKKRRLDGADAEGDSELVAVSVPAMSITPLSDCLVKANAQPQVKLFKEEGNFVLTNDLVHAVVDPLGRLLSLTCKDVKTNKWSKEAIDPDHPANQLLLYDDMPLYWDAWDIMDYHMETRTPLIDPIQRTRAVEKSSYDRVVLEMSLKISNQSYLTQEIVLDAGKPYIRFNSEVTWREKRKLLKVEFPTTVHSTEASYDTQSGFLRRPNHFNTSWDSARYEVCGHKWANVSEYGFGVGLINDCKYGHSTVDGIMRLSLLKSPKNPDPKADMGVHTFSYAIMPHFGSFQEAGLIQQALAFNAPLRTVVKDIPDVHEGKELSGLSDFFSVTQCPGVVIQATKMAEDGSKTVIIRLHEAFGGHCEAEVTSILPFTSVVACNGMEESQEDDIPVKCTKDTSGSRIHLTLSAFQIVSLRCSVAVL